MMWKNTQGRAASELFIASSPRATWVTFASGAISEQKHFEKIRHLSFFKKPGTKHVEYKFVFNMLSKVQVLGKRCVEL